MKKLLFLVIVLLCVGSVAVYAQNMPWGGTSTKNTTLTTYAESTSVVASAVLDAAGGRETLINYGGAGALYMLVLDNDTITAKDSVWVTIDGFTDTLVYAGESTSTHWLRFTNAPSGEITTQPFILSKTDLGWNPMPILFKTQLKIIVHPSAGVLSSLAIVGKQN